MNIDWSKAPEGTEAAHPGSDQIFPAWFKRDAAGLVEQICPAAGIHTWTWMGGRRDFPYGNVLRPSELKQEWTGEGLPPVGTVCEFAGFNPEETMPTDPRVGDQVTVIAHFMSGSFEVAAFTFYAPPEFEYLQVAQGAYGCFRPIRTPKQIAFEARDNEVKEMLVVWNAGFEGHVKDGLYALYDANYRKQPAP